MHLRYIIGSIGCAWCSLRPLDVVTSNLLKQEEQGGYTWQCERDSQRSIVINYSVVSSPQMQRLFTEVKTCVSRASLKKQNTPLMRNNVVFVVKVRGQHDKEGCARKNSLSPLKMYLRLSASVGQRTINFPGDALEAGAGHQACDCALCCLPYELPHTLS